MTSQYFSVPGQPQEVKVVANDTTSLQVTWQPPLDKDQNGIINGYHVYVQELQDQVATKHKYEMNLFIILCYRYYKYCIISNKSPNNEPTFLHFH